MMKISSVVFVSLAVLGFAENPKVDKDTAKNATTATKAKYHVVFKEVVESPVQHDWTDKYNATVEVYVDGKLKGTFKGSTLPNDYMPKDPKWEYSVVLSTGALSRALMEQRHYTWTRDVRAKKAATDTDRPCLRLAAKVPTINVGTERQLGMMVAGIKKNAMSNGTFNYAKDILVHSGETGRWRGSAGCLTIRPSDAEKFFALIPQGEKGTLELNRGLHDEETRTSIDF